MTASTINKTRRLVAMLNIKGETHLAEENVPAPEPGKILVRVRASWISAGTEIFYPREHPPKKIPEYASWRFGYQSSGVVESTGAGVRHLRPGDRIACFGAGHALHSNFALVPQNLCCRLPDTVSFEEGGCANVALTALTAVRRWQPELGERVLVVGLGAIGQFAGQLAQISGAYAMGWDKLPKRVKIARECGFAAAHSPDETSLANAARKFTNGYGFDAAILATGGDGTELLKQVRNVMKRTPDGHAMGKIIMVGGLSTTCSWGAGMDNLDILSSSRAGPGYHDHEWECGFRPYPAVYVRWDAQENLKLVIRLIEEHRLRVKPLITHRFPLKDIGKAINMHLERQHDVIGTVIQMSD